MNFINHNAIVVSCVRGINLSGDLISQSEYIFAYQYDYQVYVHSELKSIFRLDCGLYT